MSRGTAALGVACGFLAGVLLMVAVGTGGGSTRTVTEQATRTVTVQTPTTTTGGTVIVSTAVPDVVGQRLDVAKARLHRAGFDPDVDGGGLFGILQDSNWNVVTQDPGPGVSLEQGSSVRIHVEKR